MPRNWRLLTSLTVTGALLLVLLVSFTFITFREVFSERREAEIDNAVSLGRTIAAEVDRFVNDLDTTTLAIAGTLGLEAVSLDQQTVGPLLQRVLQQYGFVRALFITNLQGKVIASASGEGIGLDLSARPYIRALRAGRPKAWSDAIRGLQTGQVTVAFARVVQRTDGTAKAYLVTAFYPVRLAARLQATLPTDARMALIDRRGFVLHTTYDPNLPMSQRDLSSNPMIQEALSGHPVRVIAQALPYMREPRYGSIVPVTSIGWVVVFTRPLAPLEARIRGPALRQALGMTLALAFAAMILVYMARRLVRPLERLAGTAGAIARGERPEIPSELGGIETSQLSAGMRAMARAVAEREDALTDALDNERAARETTERANARLAFLTEASTLLGSSLDYETTLRNVARLAVPHFADWCAVDLVDLDGNVERLAVTHVDPAKVELAYDIQRRYPPDPDTGPIYDVLHTGQPVVVSDISEEMLRAASRDDEHFRLLRALGLTSAILAPLIAHEQTLGVLSFVWATESRRRHMQEDVTLALDLARRAAVAIENARLYERERSIAETLQRSLLRKSLPQFPGMTIASRYIPAKQETEVGGDWYDALALPDGRVGLVMGDVAGRGVQAAAVMGQLQNAVRAYAMEGHRPGIILERVARLLDLREMATLVCLVFDPGRWTVEYASAGHLPPLVVSPKGEVTLLEGGSPPLGGSGDVAFHEERAAVAPGSTILLYTDGLIEVRGESLDEGLQRLTRATAAQPGREPDALLDHIISTLLGDEASPADDVALLALRAVALDPARLHVRLDAVPPSLPVLRHALRRWLEQSEVADTDIFEITVAVSEAFSNAVEHAYNATDAGIEVEARQDTEGVSVSVRDWGRWRPPRGTNRGRGLGLIRGLMDDVQVTPGPLGTIVQMRRRLHRKVTA